VDDLVAEMLQNPLCDGLTLSGGEPFDQAWECTLLALEAAKAGKSVWVYTGYTWEHIKRLAGFDNDWDALLIATDVLVDGPFVESLKSYEAKFRGSTNQRLIEVSPSLWTDEPVLWEQEEKDLGHFEVPES
jgi:anaerobic ribonucleoside-triphosphate reductase activating protein